MLANPLNAIRTLEKNWAKVAQLSLLLTYNLFMIVDIVVILIDAQSAQDHKTNFVVAAYTFLEWI